MNNKKTKYLLAFTIPLLVWFYFCLPDPLFTVPYSNVLEDAKGRLLGATTAGDEQWRFPVVDSIPKKFEQSILQFEDAYFYKHLGVNPVALIKALYQNISAGEVVRGGSTLSMQVIRLSRQGRPRTYLEKFYECILATRLELRYSKREILNLYTAHAPFGGNVVGLEAASWRYYGRPPHLLSWGETATLAVLPNAPSLIFPGRNHGLLMAKRNKLLDKLMFNGILDSLDAELAKIEPLPLKPNALPQIAPHLLATKGTKDGLQINSTLELKTQEMVNRVVRRHHQSLKHNEIHNLAVLVVHTESGEVRAYAGNTEDPQNKNENAVDLIRAARSSGSSLKPFLYRNMLKQGQLLPATLLPDIPTYISGYSPKNFDEHFNGAVAADNALARSLNVPAVRMLQNYGVEIFLNDLKKMQFSTINKSSQHYGLSLILGGAEVKLWDLVKNYRRLAVDLIAYHDPKAYSRMHLDKSERQGFESDISNAPANWLTLQALTEMERPIIGNDWRTYESSKTIAWKTGTSFGHKDAWAIGVTPEYVVGVWVGNADGEGRPGLTGASTAAPVMFNVFRKLPGRSWFKPPEANLRPLRVCKQSGYKASKICPEHSMVSVPLRGDETALCPYHKLVHLDENQEFQVNSNCYSVSNMNTKPWFILPPVMEWYYASTDPYYTRVPAFRSDCIATTQRLDIIYPQPNAKLFIPTGFNGVKESLVFEAAYRSGGGNVYWHLDDQFLTSTRNNHQIELQPDVGKHLLTLVSEEGEVMQRSFEVVN
ncbi:MAG: penicillin-binding protein 1C [Bacteroidota bacterium]